MSEDAAIKAAILRSSAADYRRKAAAGVDAGDIERLLTVADLLEGRAKRIAAGENDFSAVSFAEVDDEQG